MPTHHYATQQTHLWTQVVKTGICVILFSLLICALSTSALTAVSKQLHFQWNYDISLPGLAGYILYQDGQRLLTINDPATLGVDYTVEVEPGQTIAFTMTAFDVNGKESAISRPYSIDIPLEVVQGNLLPTATLNLANGSGPAPLVVDFFAVGSTDLDGTIVTYAWDFGDGASGRGSTVSHTYTIAGDYTVTLTVTDNAGGVGTAKRTVTVSAPPANISPTANLSLSTGSGAVPLAVEFSADGSTDSDGAIVSYAWNFGDGASASTSTASHTYTIAGVYTVTLTVTDNAGGIGTAQSTVTCSVSTPALGMVSEQLHFQWSYDISLPGLAGYLIYQDAQRLLTINDPTTLATDYTVDVKPGTTVIFTMTAFDVNGKESAISAPYSFDVPLEVVQNLPPTAALNLSTTTGKAPLVVNFSGVGSTDPDGTIVSYTWDFGDGASASNSTASHTYTIPGVYTVTLTVTDNVGATNTAKATVTILAANMLPKASLNLSTGSGEAPLVVDFFAEGSTDSDGTIVSYAWDFGDKGSASTSTASHTYTTAGMYTVTLTVTDNDGGVGTAQRTVTVSAPPANIPPTASLDLSTGSGAVPLTVEFSAEGSTDADGIIVSYAWDFGDGASASTSIASHTYTAAGVYTVTLTVTDNAGGIGTAQSTVTCTALGMVSKQLHFQWNYDISLPGLAGYILYQNGQRLLTINDPATLAIDYTVEVEPGTTVAFTITAFDVNGNESAISAPYSFDVPLVKSNLLPTASLTLSTTSGTAPLVVNVSGVGSTDSDGTIVSYAWDFGDGASASTSTASHTYKSPGVYPVTLTVTDNDGGVAKALATVTVSAANVQPTASLTLSTTSGTAPLVVNFSATGSTDPDGSIVSYAWDFGDKGSASTSTASHTYTTAGVYPVTLTVTDNDGGIAKANSTVTVSAASGPVASISFSPQVPTTKDDVQFSGAASKAPAGNITSYLWDFGDGKSASGVTASNKYHRPGSYTVTLTVSDNYNTSSQASVVLTVKK